MEILIVGLGNIGHAMVSSITGKNIIVDTVTTNGEKVSIIKNQLDGKYEIRNNYTYDNLKEYEYDFIFITLPYIQKIKRINQIIDKISINSNIVLLPANQGLLYFLPEKLKKEYKIILLERVPQIARIEKKNELVNIFSTRTDLRYTTINNPDINKLKEIYTYLEGIIYLNNSDDISLISSNATLHTARMYNLFQDSENFNQEILFYKDWTNQDSELFIAIENEILKIAKIKAKLENKSSNVYDMYQHFKITQKTPQEVTEKISTNKGLNKITFFAKNEDELIQTRYFVDDIMLGIYFFKTLAEKYNISTPYINQIYLWGASKVGEIDEQKYLKL